MADILLWDQRFPDRHPRRLSVNDTLASAAVRAGVAAPVNQADFATLNAGGALDPATPTEIVVEDGFARRMRRIVVPVSVAAIAVSQGIGASTGVAVTPAPAPTPTPTPAPFTTLNVDGYSTSGPAAVAGNTAIPVTRQGFDQTGQAISFTETIYSLGAYFQMPPTLALSATTSVLSDSLFATDSAPGVLNNNLDAPPPGILRWQQGDQRLVGNTLKGSLIGYHLGARNGKPFACIKLTATDGTNTVTATLTDCTVDTSDPGRDQTSVWEYNYSLDVTGLSGDITLNAEAYPWIGDATSVTRSSTGTIGARGFVPQVYTKTTAAAPLGIPAANYVYVAAGGNDSTGYVGPDYNLAKASPVATLNGAYTRAGAVLGTAANAWNGLAFVLSAGTWEFTTVPTTRTVSRDIIITRDPLVAKSSVIFQFGTASVNPPASMAYIWNVSMRRNGGQQLRYSRVSIRDVDFDNNSQTLSFVWGTSAIVRIEGNFVVTNATTTTLSATSTTQFRQMRGVVAAGGSLGTPAQVDADHIVGCRLTSYQAVFTTGRADNSYDGLLIYSNLFYRAGSSSDFFNINLTTNGGLFATNVVEWCTGTGAAIGLSRDGGTANLTNVHFVHNTVTGAVTAGRINAFYDETQATPRTHKYCSFHNNILPSLNHKNLWYLYVTQSGYVDSRVGALEFFFGVNCTGTFTMNVDAGSTTGAPHFRQYYPGRAAQMSASSVNRVDPLFVDYEGMTNAAGTSTTVAGAGNGNYGLLAGSPCRNAGIKRVLPGGINGVAFAPTPNLGAYA